MTTENKFPTTRIKVKIEDVFPNAWNPNTQSDKVYEKLKQSIDTFGFIDFPLVREKDEIYEIIDGEHKWRAAKEQGYTEIIVDSLGKIDDNTAKLLTINLNNLRGQDNVLKRAEVLKQLKAGQLSILPFDEKQIEEEIKLLDFDFSQFEKIEVITEDEDDVKSACKFVLQFENLMRRLHNKSKNIQLKVLIETFFQWRDKFCSCIKDE